MRKNTVRKIIISVSFIALIAVFFIVYQLLRTRSSEGAKTIHLNVIVSEASIKSLNLHTDAQYLRQALEEENLIQGDEGVYGLWVTTVADRVAKSENEEWWALYKNDQLSMTGVDDTPIEDGDNIEFRLIIGYDDVA